MDDFDPAHAGAMMAEAAAWASLGRDGVRLATFAGLDADGRFLVSLSDALEPLAALSTVALSGDERGARVVVAFENGNVRRPVIVGRLVASAPCASVKIDGERVVLSAAREIELRCGEASLVLTSAGKVIIRGNYIVSRSRGANRIKGAFVDIN